MSTTTDIRPLIGVAAARPLTGEEAEAAFGALFDGKATPAQIGGLLMAMRVRGETVDEIAAAVPVGPVHLIGDGTLCARYAEALAHRGIPATVAEPGAANRGLAGIGALIEWT